MKKWGVIGGWVCWSWKYRRGPLLWSFTQPTHPPSIPIKGMSRRRTRKQVVYWPFRRQELEKKSQQNNYAVNCDNNPENSCKTSDRNRKQKTKTKKMKVFERRTINQASQGTRGELLLEKADCEHESIPAILAQSRSLRERRDRDNAHSQKSRENAETNKKNKHYASFSLSISLLPEQDGANSACPRQHSCTGGAHGYGDQRLLPCIVVPW